MQINESLTSLTDTNIPSVPLLPRDRGTSAGSTDGRRARGFHRLPRRAELDHLTPREHQVLVHLSKGLRYKEIVDRLGISQGTLHFFIRNLYAKLRVHSRTEAVMKLVKW